MKSEDIENIIIKTINIPLTVKNRSTQKTILIFYLPLIFSKFIFYYKNYLILFPKLFNYISKLFKFDFKIIEFSVQIIILDNLLF